jgi:hypothetical protein
MQKRDESREKVEMPVSSIIDFVGKGEAELCIRRVGGRTGQAFVDFSDTSTTSNYYIKVKPPYTVQWLCDTLNSIDFTNIVSATAGAKSLSKPELIDILNKRMQCYLN